MIYQPLLDLIRNHKNWKELLEQEPRFIKIKQCPWKDKDDNLLYPELYMLSYDGIYSDFNDEIVRLCRGCVVSIENELCPTMIVEPFTKFGNWGQDFCPDIDWNTALVQAKVDGILIKLFNYKNKWYWITNNGWDTNVETSFITKLPSKYKETETDNCKTVQDLIDYSLKEIHFDLKLHKLDHNFTYMFELISPKLRILVDNPKTKLIYLGCRNNITQLELNLEQAYVINFNLQMFETVNYFDLHNINEVLELCKSYKGDEDEGVVVCDEYFNRIKIKCENYILLKGYRNAFDTTDEKILNGIRNGTIDDAIGAFPEIQNTVNEIKENLTKYVKFITNLANEGKIEYNRLLNLYNNDIKLAKKNFTMWVNNLNTKYAFAYFEGTKNVIDFARHIDKVSYKEIKDTLTNE